MTIYQLTSCVCAACLTNPVGGRRHVILAYITSRILYGRVYPNPTGIGQAIAIALAQLGAQLVLAARNQTTLEAATADACTKSGGKAIAVPTDVTERASLPTINRTCCQYLRGDRWAG